MLCGACAALPLYSHAKNQRAIWSLKCITWHTPAQAHSCYIDMSFNAINSELTLLALPQNSITHHSDTQLQQLTHLFSHKIQLSTIMTHSSNSSLTCSHTKFNYPPFWHTAPTAHSPVLTQFLSFRHSFSFNCHQLRCLVLQQTVCAK